MTPTHANTAGGDADGQFAGIPDDAADESLVLSITQIENRPGRVYLYSRARLGPQDPSGEMIMRKTSPARAWRAAFVAVLTTVSSFAMFTPTAEAAVSPVVPRTRYSVTADPLPTVQINGIVWTQAIHGRTVYAGGKFSTARRPGAAPGTHQTRRQNLLAYDIRTGRLTKFNPGANAQIKTLVVSPDGSRLYVGGDFTRIAGHKRSRIAAFGTATGKLIKDFRPVINSTVTAITATRWTVYVGGSFGLADGRPRARLAAFRARDGALTRWAPSANAGVTSMLLTPDRSKIVVGGSFTRINQRRHRGVAAIRSRTGQAVRWPVSRVLHDGGRTSGTFSLSRDKDTIYGTAYDLHGGNFEGAYAMHLNGTVKWLADCHGDTYSTFSVHKIVYAAGHQHFCANIGGFPEHKPRVYKRLMAFTKRATGIVRRNTETRRYGNFQGNPSPSIIDYFPSFTTGNVSGAHQAVWSLVGNGSYLAAGGEFPTVGGVRQQGLVRFAISSIAPDKVGVSVRGGMTNPTAHGVAGQGARVSWKLNWDPDNMKLIYKITRRDMAVKPVHDVTVHIVAYRSTWWRRPMASYLDRSARPGHAYRYRVSVQDAAGNGTVSDWVPVTIPGAAATVQPPRSGPARSDRTAPGTALDGH